MSISGQCPGSMSPFCLRMAKFNCCGASKNQEKVEEPKTK